MGAGTCRANILGNYMFLEQLIRRGKQTCTCPPQEIFYLWGMLRDHIFIQLTSFGTDGSSGGGGRGERSLAAFDSVRTFQLPEPTPLVRTSSDLINCLSRSLRLSLRISTSHVGCPWRRRDLTTAFSEPGGGRVSVYGLWGYGSQGSSHILTVSPVPTLHLIPMRIRFCTPMILLHT